MCTSCTDRSSPLIGPVLHWFTMESASASLTSLPGTYLMLTSYCCMRSSICANLGGAAKRCLVQMDRRIGGIAQVRTRCPTFRVQCWNSDFLFQSVTYWRMRWAIGLQQCRPESSLRSINLDDERLCTVIVSQHLI